MGKSLCKMKKKVEKSFDSYVYLVNDPHYICTKCGRAANRKKNLCDPRKIEDAN